MRGKKVGINDVSRAVGPAYEYVRRWVRGGAVPSNYILKPLCDYFDWNYSDIQQIATADRMRIKFGKLGIGTQALNSAIEPFSLAWPYLTDVQKTFLTSQVRDFLDLNIANEVK